MSGGRLTSLHDTGGKKPRIKDRDQKKQHSLLENRMKQDWIWGFDHVLNPPGIQVGHDQWGFKESWSLKKVETEAW